MRRGCGKKIYARDMFVRTRCGHVNFTTQIGGVTGLNEPPVHLQPSGFVDQVELQSVLGFTIGLPRRLRIPRYREASRLTLYSKRVSAEMRAVCKRNEKRRRQWQGPTLSSIFHGKSEDPSCLDLPGHGNVGIAETVCSGV